MPPRARANNDRRIDEIPEFTSKALPGEKEARKDQLQFKFDGELFTLNRPKMSIAIPLLNLALGNDSRTVTELGMDIVNLITGILGYVEKEHPGPDGQIRGQARLMNRLSDPRDELDILHLNEPFQQLMIRMFENPTSSRPESSGPRSRTSGGGAAASR